MEADSGEQCLALLENNRPDLALLDIRMPGISGIEVLKRIRSKEQYKKLPIIMLTGEQAVEDKVAAFKAGASDYVEKNSLNILELQARVENFIKTTRLFRDLEDEIKRRKKAEKALHHEKEALEDLNAELVLAKREIENNALEAGRIQVGAMIYHQIGNTMTPLSVGLSKIDMDVFSRISGQLATIFEDLSAHTGNLTEYVNQDPKGSRIFNHIQDIAKAIDQHTEQCSRNIKTLKAACSKITRILSENQTYLSGQKEDKGFVDLNKTISRAVYSLEDEITKREIITDLNLSDRMPKLRLHPAKIVQVVINLLKNAVEAFDPPCNRMSDRMIHIRTYAREGLAGFEIQDNGCGLESSRSDEIFKFGSSQKGASGFGLYYSKMYIEANNGLIDFESQGPEKGSSVIVVFRTPQITGEY